MNKNITVATNAIQNKMMIVNQKIVVTDVDFADYLADGKTNLTLI